MVFSFDLNSSHDNIILDVDAFFLFLWISFFILEDLLLLTSVVLVKRITHVTLVMRLVFTMVTLKIHHVQQIIILVLRLRSLMLLRRALVGILSRRTHLVRNRALLNVIEKQKIIVFSVCI